MFIFLRPPSLLEPHPPHTLYVYVYAVYFTLYYYYSYYHRVHIFTRDETGLVYLPTQLERTLQLYW